MTAKTWITEHHPVVGFLASVVAIGTVVWAAARFVFAPPDLAITVQTSPLQFPYYMYERLNKALMTDSTRLSDSSGLAIRQVRGFLRDTESFTQITITNSSSRSLANADLRFHYVHDADGYAIEGDALDDEERKKLIDAIRFDPANGLLTLRNVPRIPPKSTMKLYVWGDVSYAALWGRERVTVTYDGGAGELVTERTVRGLDAFIYDNAGLLVIVVLLLNLAVWGFYLEHTPLVTKNQPHPGSSSNIDRGDSL